MMMLNAFLFNFNKLVDFELLPQCQTVNRGYHKNVLQRLGEKIRKKRSELW